MKRIYLLAYLLFAVLILGCEKSKVEIPSYIQIDEILLSTNNSVQGTNSSKFTDAWVTVNDKSVGTFELPAKFPVLADGNSKIGIGAGIKLNGATASRHQPLLFTTSITDTILKAGSVIKIKPVVKYASYAKFAWLENFESNGFTLSGYSTSKNISVTNNTTKVFEGNKCGIFSLSDTSNSYSVMSVNKFALPKDGSNIYLELNYSSSVQFVIGLVVNYQTSPSLPKQIIYLNSTTADAFAPKWNKIYISLTQAVSEAQTSSDVNILFSCNKREGVSYDEVLVDNIKIVY